MSTASLPSLASPPLRWLVGSMQTYLCETRSVLRLNQLSTENRLRTLVEVRVLDRAIELDGYAVRVRVLSSEQTQQQGLHQLLAALSQVSEVLELEVDAQGYARRVLNRPELLARWRGVRAALRQRFREFPQTEALLAGLDQQLLTPGALEASVLPHGLYGLLFAGYLGQSFGSQEPGRAEAWELPGFFGDVGLPLLLRKRAVPPPPDQAPGPKVHLAVDGQLDTERFAHDRWRRLLRQVTDTPALDPTLHLRSHATYELAALDGVLQRASQQLCVEVPRVYRNELSHHLTLQPPARHEP